MSAPREPFVRVTQRLGGDVMIWFEPIEGAKGEGLCVGIGDTLPDALADAFEALHILIGQMHELVIAAHVEILATQTDALERMMRSVREAERVVERALGDDAETK